MKSLKKYLVIGFLLYPLWGYLFKRYAAQNVDNIFGLISIAFAVLMIFFKINRHEKLRFPHYLGFLLLFYIYTVIINTATGSVVEGKYGFLFYLFLNENFTPIVMFFIIENMDIDTGFLKFAKPLALLLFFVSIAVILVQHYVPFFWMDVSVVDSNEYLDFQQRLFSIYTWVSSNAVGISFPFIIAFLYTNYKNNFLKLVIAAGALLFALFTQTRYIIISTVMILSFLYFKGNKFKPSKLLLFLFIPVFFYLVLLLFSFDVTGFVNSRLLESDSDVDFDQTSAGSRVVSLHAFVNIFPEHPFFGNGEKITPLLRRYLGPDLPYIHIGFLHYLYAYGLFGFSLFSAFCYLLLKRVYGIAKVIKDYSFFIGLVALLFANTTLVWFKFFDFGIFICYLALLTNYKDYKKMATEPSVSNFDVNFKNGIIHG